MSGAAYEEVRLLLEANKYPPQVIGAFRAEVIAERDAQIIAWLGKKAGEYGVSNRENRAKAEAVGRMADKLSRGAVRDQGKAAQELDPEFPATKAGGHALVIEYGDCEMYGSCQCGKDFGTARPDKPLDRFAGPWERHVMTEVAR
ncbi:hypothetical protein HRW18_30940 [Streptomyces lunaelactis]|uniref:hypothetical protein n=1 Tax=Streptomyces lunaelactis TaxID=1535768 RepID=UPI0015856636|nr:hypothetical protein [Streptomyces lunaelactis]NUK12315.1 hypothetical protein [Streptomyces lunaelactis]